MRRAVIIIPTLNEEARIGGLLSQLSRLSDGMVPEILVADGRSADRTRAIVEEWTRRDPRIRLIDNPDRLQSAGMNRAVAAARPGADTIIRIDAHAHYPDDYIPRILTSFEETRADLVATRLVTVAESCLQRGIASAMNSWGGTGGSAHRVGGPPRWVDHGHHAGVDRALYEAVGGYDERFVANEDAEFDTRARALGGRIWLATDITADYFPRATFRALARQYFRYGTGRAGTFLKHRERLRPRQTLPPLATLGVAGGLLLALVWPWGALVPALYFAAILTLTARIFAKAPSRCSLAAAPAMAIMHLCWGAGFLLALLRGKTGPYGTNVPPRAIQPAEAR